MRKDTAAQVETREISDSDLDNVSGGVLGLVYETLGTVDPFLGSTLSDVSGLLTGVTGVLAL